MNNIHLSSGFYRNLVFVVGILATFCYRAIAVMNDFSKLWVDIFWYMGTIGFVWYFAHRFRVEIGREKLIEKFRLDEKASGLSELQGEEKEALVYTLKSLKTSKARWNYIFIFVFSAVSLLYAVYSDFLK